MLNMDYGLTNFEFFPAWEANGDVKTLQTISDLFSQVPFYPTGGISSANYRDYLALNSVLCGGESWLVPNDALEQGSHAYITQLVKKAVAGKKALPGTIVLSRLKPGLDQRGFTLA